MKPPDDLERTISQANETTSSEMDSRVLQDIRSAMAASPGRSIRLPVGFLAAAAAMIFALLMLNPLSREPEPPQDRRATLSVGEMVSVKHLNVAYRRGGMQAIEDLCDEAAERVNLRPNGMSLKDLMAELYETQTSSENSEGIEE